MTRATSLKCPLEDTQETSLGRQSNRSSGCNCFVPTNNCHRHNSNNLEHTRSSCRRLLTSVNNKYYHDQWAMSSQLTSWQSSDRLALYCSESIAREIRRHWRNNKQTTEKKKLVKKIVGIESMSKRRRRQIELSPIVKSSSQNPLNHFGLNCGGENTKNSSASTSGPLNCHLILITLLALAALVANTTNCVHQPKRGRQLALATDCIISGSSYNCTDAQSLDLSSRDSLSENNTNVLVKHEISTTISSNYYETHRLNFELNLQGQATGRLPIQEAQSKQNEVATLNGQGKFVVILKSKIWKETQKEARRPLSAVVDA